MRFSLRVSLGCLIASGLVAAALLTAVSILSGRHVAATTQNAYDAKDLTADILPPPLYLIELRLALSEAVEGARTAAETRSDLTRLEKDFDDRVTYWSGHPVAGVNDELMGKQVTEGRNFLGAAHRLVDALERGDGAGARAELKAADTAYRAHRAGVDETVKAANAYADKVVDEADSARSRAAQLQGIIFLAAVLGLVGLGLWLGRGVMRAIGGEPAQVAAIAQDIARGDLSTHIPETSRAPGSIMDTVRQMRDNLARIVCNVRGGVESVSTASGQIAAGNQDLSQRTEAQASSLQQTAASMEQLTSTVKASSDSARQANQLASQTRQAAATGGQVVGSVVSTMNDISDSSKRMADIIGVIDGIAFQTNILALNAAVEAARAGEQGRGFAVVAEEVRSLAHRSGQAAREIKTIIDESVQKVGSGSRLVGEAVASMEEIVRQVSRVTDLIGEISSSALEQTSGINQISSAVTQMDQATQQNAALVEQSAAAAHSLKEQAGRLAETVAIFKLSASPVAA
jgi:methyl-accepting chemotaxis protein